LLLIAAAMVAAVVVAVAVRSISSASRAPVWWEPAGKLEVDAADRAEGLERGVMRALYEVRPSNEPWTVELREADANAWLARRLDRWLRNREIKNPAEAWRVKFADGRVLAGAKASMATGRYPWVSLTPEVTADGKLMLSSARWGIGRTEFSTADSVATMIESALGNDAARVMAMMRGDEAVGDAMVKLDDGRRVELQRIEVGDGWVRLTAWTRSGE